MQHQTRLSSCFMSCTGSASSATPETLGDSERTSADAKHGYTRREMLSFLAKGAVTYSLGAAGLFGAAQHKAPPKWQLTDKELLEEIVKRAFLFFWNEAGIHSGLVRDRALADGTPDNRLVSSIAATGFGLAALCIGHKRGYLPAHKIRARVITTLSALVDHVEQVNGFFYHFIDVDTGRRVGLSEVSPIDTTILLCGALTAREYFHDPQVTSLVDTIYKRINWRWMLDDGMTFAKGWTPEHKFIDSRWDTYCELMMMYLLAIAAPTYNISPSSWNAVSRPVQTFEGHKYIGGPDPLFVHQYSQTWFDFRNQRDRYADYFVNSSAATYVHKRFCISLHNKFPDYDENTWGITASDSRRGYQVWGGPPPIGKIDGTVVPCAAGGSIPFVPKDTLACLNNLYSRYGQRAWKKYGFVDAFNPLTGWTDPDVVGIDQGITMLMAENYRTGFIWKTFMKNPEAQRAMTAVGFRPYAPAAVAA
jgi:hypothetical protein